MNEVILPIQHRGRGWVLRITAWITRVAGVIAALGGWQRVRTSSTANVPGYYGPPWYILVLIGIGVMALGICLIAFSLVLGRYSRLHLTKTITLSDLEPRSYVLYLRPFTHDAKASALRQPGNSSNAAVQWALRSGRTHEETLRSIVRRLGPLVAVGRPGEILPGGSGAHRGYLPLDDWKDEVRRLMKDARLVILGTGSGTGTLWEYAEAIRILEPRRLALIITEKDEYQIFKMSTIAELQGILYELKGKYGEHWDSPILPDLPELRAMGADKTFYVKALVHFTEDWEPHLRYFTLTRRWHSRWSVATMAKRAWSPVLEGASDRAESSVGGRRRA